jgi:hypothetical protein
MLTKELTRETREPVRFIEPMYAEAGRAARGSIWTYEAKLEVSLSGSKTREWCRAMVPARKQL